MTAKDEVQVTVAAAPVVVNNPPTGTAGANRTVQVGKQFTINDASFTDPENDPLTYEWYLSHGSYDNVSFVDRAQLKLQATINKAETYHFAVWARDGKNPPPTSKYLIITAAVNKPPVVNVGLNKSLTLAPASNGTYAVTTTLQGSATDDFSAPTLTYNWTLQSGPASVTFSNWQSPTSQVTFTAAGTYTLLFKVGDGALWAQGTLQVQVANDPKFQQYLDYKGGNHGTFAVLSYADYTSFFTALSLNAPVPGYYNTYRQSAGSQALTLVDWFRLNQDDIKMKFFEDSLSTEDVDSSLDIDFPSDKYINDAFNSDLDSARLPNTSEAVDPNLLFGRHAIKFEYDFPAVKTKKIPIPYTPFEFWAELSQLKVGCDGNYLKEPIDEGYKVVINANGGAAYEAKLKAGREYKFRTLHYVFYDSSIRKMCRSYYKFEGEMVVEAVFTDNFLFKYNSVRLEQFYMPDGPMYTWGLGAGFGGKVELGGFPVRIKGEYVLETFNPVAEVWDIKKVDGLSNVSFEAGVKGSVSWNTLVVKYISSKNLPNPEDESLVNGNWVVIETGQVTGAIQADIKFKFNGKFVAGYSWAPKITQWFSGKRWVISRQASANPKRL